MAQQVSIEQAMANALVTYLSGALTDVIVSPRWPNPAKNLPPKAITVVPAGRRQALDTSGSFIRSVAVETAFLVDGAGNQILDDNGNPLVDDKHKVYTYTIEACVHPIQLDVWALTDFDRDDIVARLDAALSANLVTTIGAANDDPFRDGPLLPLGDGYTGFADFIFDGPLKDDSTDSASRAEFRASYNGNASAHLTLKRQLPTMSIFKLKLRVAEVIGSGLSTDTYTLLTTGAFDWTTP